MKNKPMTKTKSKLNRAVKPNVTPVSDGRYRCRITKKGKYFETYTTSLRKADLWLKEIKSGKVPANTVTKINLSR